MHNYSKDEYERISGYFRMKRDSGNADTLIVDDITWNDLDMDQFFRTLDNTSSQNGGEYLYDMLRRPLMEEKELKERGRVADFFKERKDIRDRYLRAFENAGNLEKSCFHEKVRSLDQGKTESNLAHYFSFCIGAAAIAAIFLNPPLGFVLFIIASVFNVTTYFKRKGEIESFIPVFRYLIREIRECRQLLKIETPELKDYRDRLELSLDILKGIERNAWIVTTGKKLTGGLLELPLDFIRIFFHPDLIKFNNMLKTAHREKEAVYELFNVTGFLDAMISVSLFRENYGVTTEPVFKEEDGIEVRRGYHPLLKNPVPYDIDNERLVLLTGSNASGKSTFLKSVALSIILSETIYTVPAESFSCPRLFCMTSMSIRDSIMDGESLYMAEILSVKRILSLQKRGIRTAVFLDEVLKGTNTVERIASLSVLLKKMGDEKGSHVFAATHDTPLTEILEDIYSLYHFDEEITENGITFPYELYKGKTESRDAIMLLSVMGFDEDVTKMAFKMSDSFMEEGTWKKL